MIGLVSRRSCQHPDKCRAAGRGGPCRTCDAVAIARRAVLLRERIAANRAEGRPLYAQRPSQPAAEELGGRALKEQDSPSTWDGN